MIENVLKAVQKNKFLNLKGVQILEKIRVAVIGLFHGMNHVRSALKCEDAQLVALCDLKEKYRKDAVKYGVPFYLDYNEMFEKEEIDGVVLAIPNNLHAQLSEECGKRGINVLVEKPVASTIKDADRIIEAEKKYNIKILVGHHRRFSTYIQRLREAVQKKEIGEFVCANIMWNTLKNKEYYQEIWRTKEGGGILNINAIHDIDDMRFIVGDISQVYAEISNRIRDFDVEDTASIVLKFKEGGMANIILSDCTPSPFFYEASCYEDKGFSPTLKDCYYIFGTKASIAMPSMEKYYYIEEEREGWRWPITNSRIEIPRVNPMLEEMKNFCKIIRGEEQAVTTAKDAKKSLKVILAIKDSARTGKTVQID